MKDVVHSQVDKQLQELEYAIELVYKSAGVEVSKELEKVLSKLDMNLTEQQRYNYLMQRDRLTNLLKKLSEEVRNANIVAMQMMNDELIDIYKENYNYGAYLVENASGFKADWSLYNKQTIKQILTQETTPFTLMALDDIKDKDMIIRALTRELTTGILTGDSIPKIAKRVQGIVNRNKADAIRIARTETTRVENAGRLDSFKQGEKMGLKLKKKWISTIDSRTRTSHVHMMGEEVGLDENFSNGLDHPGGMGGSAKDVCNCRCAMLVEFEGLKLSASDKTLDETLKNQSYKPWGVD